MDRRDFVLRTGAAVVAGSWTVGCAGESAQAGADAGTGRLERVGLQLYTVRDLMAKDVQGTLESVAGIGYTEVEFAGYFDHEPAAIRSMLTQTGLRSPSAHIPIEAFREDRARAIATVLEIGHEFAIVPWIAPAERNSVDNWLRIADEFNTFGRACREQGVRFGYHNHDFEFTAAGGQLPYDLLLEHCDPDVVCFEMDLYWIRKGGQQPLQYFDRFPGRFALCHVKDMDQNGDMKDVGSGQIDFGAIFARSKQAGLEHYFVEHDNPGDALQSIGKSYTYLNALRFGS